MFQIGIFDGTKGKKEGQEAEKIVGWYPLTTEVDYQVRSVGLLQGLLQFSSVFDSGPREFEVAEFEDGYWVVGQLSFPPLFLSIFVRKPELGRHVTEENLLGLIRNFDDILRLLIPEFKPEVSGLVDDTLNSFGDNLCQRGSWLRKQLRNPFCLTNGASCTELPLGLSGLIAAKFESHANVVLFRDNICVFSSFDDEMTALLGSLVTSGTYGRFQNQSVSRIEKSSGRVHVLEIRDKSKLYFIEQDSYLIFARPIGCDAGVNTISQIDRIIQDAIEAIQTRGWSAKISNHVPGSRYCYKEDTKRRHICSPREKTQVAAFAFVIKLVIFGVY